LSAAFLSADGKLDFGHLAHILVQRFLKKTLISAQNLENKGAANFLACSIYDLWFLR
jgi:hypothetical protein